MSAHAPIGVIGQYNLLEMLPRSGPGDLYRARDTKHGRTVGLRLLLPDFASTPSARLALIEGARVLVRLSHPNVTTLFDLGEHEGRVYLVFEFLVGQSLRAEMVGHQVRLRRALEIAIQIADGVADAHGLGFAHGALSPESIVVTTRGHAKIPAFHLAVRDGFDTGDSATLKDYASPEETRGEPPDDRSDVYSIGAILYEMLTARRPSPRGASAPSASNARVPQGFDGVVLKAIAPNPASRYGSAMSLAAELRGLLAQLDAAGGAADEDDLPTEPRDRPAHAWLVVAALVPVAVAIWWLTRP